MFTIMPLTRTSAFEHRHQLIRLHNQIPFQHWNVSDLLAEGDAERKYTDKWRISQIALDPEGRPLAFCTGFRNEVSAHYPEPGVYLHRLAVHPAHRHSYVGAIVLSVTIMAAFDVLQQDRWVYGQTNDTEGNEDVLRFYVDAGYEPMGYKQYADRRDVTMRMTKQQHTESRHYRLRTAQALTAGREEVSERA